MIPDKPSLTCGDCGREYFSRTVYNLHFPEQCEANQAYDKKYRRGRDAMVGLMRDMRERLGDPDPDDPTKVHVTPSESSGGGSGEGSPEEERS